MSLYMKLSYLYWQLQYLLHRTVLTVPTQHIATVESDRLAEISIKLLPTNCISIDIVDFKHVIFLYSHHLPSFQEFVPIELRVSCQLGLDCVLTNRTL